MCVLEGIKNEKYIKGENNTHLNTFNCKGIETKFVAVFGQCFVEVHAFFLLIVVQCAPSNVSSKQS